MGHLTLPVFTFWDGPQRPPYIDLCLDAMRRYAPSIQVLDESTVGEWIDVPSRFDDVSSLAARTDIYRMLLLREHGGVWLDADTVLLRDIDWLLALLDKHESIDTGHGNAVLAARPSAAMVHRWIARQAATTATDWCAFGIGCYVQAAHTLPLDYAPVWMMPAPLTVTKDTRMVQLTNHQLSADIWWSTAPATTLRLVEPFRGALA